MGRGSAGRPVATVNRVPVRWHPSDEHAESAVGWYCYLLTIRTALVERRVHAKPDPIPDCSCKSTIRIGRYEYPRCSTLRRSYQDRCLVDDPIACWVVLELVVAAAIAAVGVVVAGYHQSSSWTVADRTSYRQQVAVGVLADQRVPHRLFELLERVFQIGCQRPQLESAAGSMDRQTDPYSPQAGFAAGSIDHQRDHYQ